MMGKFFSKLLGLDCFSEDLPNSEKEDNMDKRSGDEEGEARAGPSSSLETAKLIFVPKSKDQKKAASTANRKRSSADVEATTSTQKCPRFGRPHQYQPDNVSIASDGTSATPGPGGDATSAASSNIVYNINDLPAPLLLQIFKNLPLQDVLRRASLVCKYWHDLTRDPDLWRVINLRSQIKVDNEVLTRVTTYSDNVTSLDITDSRLVTNEGVITALACCSQLQSLILTRCQQLTKPAFEAIGENCHQLVKLSMDCCYGVEETAIAKIAEGCGKLERVRLNQCSQVNDTAVQALAEGCPRLACICLDQCSQVTDKSIEALVNCCPSLNSISAMGCNLTDDGLAYLTQLPKLKMLEVSNIKTLTNQGVIKVVQHCKELESLNISLCHAIDDNCVFYIAKHAPAIKSLFLVSCKLTDQALISLGRNCKKLETLDVGWCEQITDEGVLSISQDCKTLHYLGLMRCDKVAIPTTEDLVVKYPHITYSTVWLDCKRLLEKAQKQGFLPDADIPALANINQVPNPQEPAH